jgi:hypothetical protein
MTYSGRNFDIVSGATAVFRALRARKANSVYQSSAADFPRAR